MSYSFTGPQGGPAGVPATTLAGTGAVCGIGLLAWLTPGAWTSEVVHASIEAAGAGVALTVATILGWGLRRRAGTPAHHLWISCALSCMGILGAFHACAPVGNAFSWLKGGTHVLGGLFFAATWLPPRFPGKRVARVLPCAVGAGAVALGVFLFMHGASLPAFLDGSGFTPLAKGANVTGGALFLAAAARFFFLHRSGEARDGLLFANCCWLFAGAGLLFPLVSLWTPLWWAWHALRLGAYVVVLSYLLDAYSGALAELEGANASLRAVAEALRTSEGQVRGLLERQRTERRESEERLRGHAEALHRSNRELEEFATVASHDLQEPLRKVRSFGELLKLECGDKLTPEGRDYLARMQDGARRMQVFIEDLLAYSRVTSCPRTLGRVDLTEVARQAMDDLDVRVRESGGRVELGELPTVEADATQMRQLLQNLIGNGLKFHRPGEAPFVRVEGRLLKADGAACGTTGGEAPGPASAREPSANAAAYCQVVVTDNGIGFDDADAVRLFQLFQRLRGHSEFEGTGLGLAICRKIVERHGGAIEARGVLGQGATFTVTLPVRQVAGRGEAAPPAIG
ncbi:MAG: hypothetical protein HYZ53_14355 [Planctomycetes bacterium]|nr:hypothetical protein [Planctomycetota bacterium]